MVAHSPSHIGTGPGDAEECGLPPEGFPEGAQEPGRLCVLCRECMEPGYNVQALHCMHLFHAECLLGYAEVKGRPWSECCRYK